MESAGFERVFHPAALAFPMAVDTVWRRAYDGCMNARRELVEIPGEWLEEFEAAALRPLSVRWRYAFVHTYKPVLDDASYRSFDTTEDYRRWCNENLPLWLGYATV